MYRDKNMGFIFVSVILKTVLTHFLFFFFRPSTFPVPDVLPFLTSFLKNKPFSFLSPHLHHNLFSFLHLPGFCAA